MVATMAQRPIIFALANPYPEIEPADAKAVRPDAIIATGRSDYPNQVNNALCFPYIFRGALDVGATGINEAMKLACVRAIAKLARMESSDGRLRATCRSGRVPDPRARHPRRWWSWRRRLPGGNGIGRAASDRHMTAYEEKLAVHLPHRPGEAGRRPARRTQARGLRRRRGRDRCAGKR